MTAPSIGAESGNAANTVTWSAVPEAVSYRIYRSTQRAEGYTEIGTSESTTFTDTTAENEVPYFYTVAAVGQVTKVNRQRRYPLWQRQDIQANTSLVHRQRR